MDFIDKDAKNGPRDQIACVNTYEQAVSVIKSLRSKAHSQVI
jgi:hypothetical protein